MSVLSMSAVALSQGECIQISKSNLSDILYSLGDVLTWSATAVYDSGSKKITWICKQAQTSIFHRLEYDVETNTWSENLDVHADLTNADYGHGYDGMAIDYDTGDIYVLIRINAGSFYPIKWTASTQTWSQLPSPQGTTIPDPNDQGVSTEGIEWWPGRGLVTSYYNGVYLWDGSTWTQIITGGLITFNTASSWGEVQKNQNLYAFGKGTTLYLVDNQNNISLSTPPVSIYTGGADGGRLIQAPGTAKFILWEPELSKWYEFDPVTDEYLALTAVTGDGSTAASGTPNLNATGIIIPVFEYGVMMFVTGNYTNCEVWLYKHQSSNTERTPFYAEQGIDNNVTLTWREITGALTYDLQIATDENFSSLVVDTTVSTNSYTASLDIETEYFWRFRQAS